MPSGSPADRAGISWQSCLVSFWPLLSPLRLSYIFTWQSSTLDSKRKDGGGEVRGGRREKKRRERGRECKKPETLLGLFGLGTAPWRPGGCRQIRNTCTRLCSQHTRLQSEGAKPSTCCFRSGQAGAGEAVKTELHLCPPVLGERGGDGNSDWFYGLWGSGRSRDFESPWIRRPGEASWGQGIPGSTGQ